MKTRFKRIIGFALAALTLTAIFPMTISAEALMPSDSPDYIKTADGKLELLYNDTITENGKKYIGFTIARDYAGIDGIAGIELNKAAVDYDGNAVTEPNMAHLSLIDKSYQKIGEFEQTLIPALPQVVQENLLMYKYSIGNFGMLPGQNYAAAPSYNKAKLTFVSKDILDKHKEYLKEMILDNTFDGTDEDKVALAFTSATPYRLWNYNAKSGIWAEGMQQRPLRGSIFPMFYVSTDVFKSLKFDVFSMGENVKPLFRENISRAEISAAGYTDSELSALGYPEKYILSITNTPLLTEGKIKTEYSFFNNDAAAADVPVIFAAAYGENGEMVGLNYFVPESNTVIEPNTNMTADITIAAESVPSYIALYALKSILEPVPVADSAVFGTVSINQPEISNESVSFSYTVNETENPKTVEFSVSGTLAEKKERLFVAITKPEMKFSDLDGNNEISDILLYFIQTQTDENGKYGIKFTKNADKLEYKKYTAYVSGGLGLKTDDKVYLDNDFDTKAAADFKTMTVDEFVQAYGELLRADTVLIGLLSEEQKTLAKSAVITENVSAQDIMNMLNRESAVQLISEAKKATDAEDAIRNYNKYLNLNLTDWIEVLSDKNSVYTALANETFSSFLQLECAYWGAVLVAQINKASYYKDIKGILKNHADEAKILGVDPKLANFDGIAKYLNANPYNTWGDFKNDFEKATERYQKNKQAGSGGGGASSGGGSRNISPGDTIVINPKTPEKPPQKPKTEEVFSDIDNVKWAKSYIEKLAKLGIINGKEKNKFYPNDYITREEAAKIFSLCLGLDISSADGSFSDVKKDAWFAGFVAAAYRNGIVKGISEESFGVGEKITRQDLAVMAYRAANTEKSDILKGSYTDDSEISDYAKEAVYALTKAGVLSGRGDGGFFPKSCITRAEAAKIICIAVLGDK